MSIDKESAEKILAHLDKDEIAQLACDLVNIPSPTGKEKGVAEFIMDWFKANGLRSVRQKSRQDSNS